VSLLHAILLLSTTPATLDLEWTAPPECPSGEDVRAEVERIAGRATGPRRHVEARGQVERTERGAWRVTLTTRVEGGGGRRTFEAESCRAGADAAALILAIAANPQVAIPAPTPTLTPTPTRTPTPLPRPVGSVGDETHLLREADAALRGGDAARALALLDDHARLYPSGVLAEERSVERIFALCKLGRTTEARAHATRFLRAHPDSPLADGVRASCAMAP
jgi:hypothetical protein